MIFWIIGTFGSNTPASARFICRNFLASNPARASAFCIVSRSFASGYSRNFTVSVPAFFRTVLFFLDNTRNIDDASFVSVNSRVVSSNGTRSDRSAISAVPMMV